MDNQRAEQEVFSLVKRAKSFTHAWRGVGIVLQTTHNAWVEILLAALAVAAGAYFQITQTDWLFIALAAGLVLTAEAINTAIEIDINLTSPQFHPFARDTKDVAAGAVLIASITAAIIGLVIFVPYLLGL